MIKSYQEQKSLEQEQRQPDNASFATIGGIYSDGVSLIFDGDTVASTKHYKVNASIVFNSGDRVKIIKDSGTYVVEYPVGNPHATANRIMRVYNLNEINIDTTSGDWVTGITEDGHGTRPDASYITVVQLNSGNLYAQIGITVGLYNGLNIRTKYSGDSWTAWKLI